MTPRAIPNEARTTRWTGPSRTPLRRRARWLGGRIPCRLRIPGTRRLHSDPCGGSGPARRSWNCSIVMATSVSPAPGTGSVLTTRPEQSTCAASGASGWMCTSSSLDTGIGTSVRNRSPRELIFTVVPSCHGLSLPRKSIGNEMGYRRACRWRFLVASSITSGSLLPDTAEAATRRKYLPDWSGVPKEELYWRDQSTGTTARCVWRSVRPQDLEEGPGRTASTPESEALPREPSQTPRIGRPCSP
jgi:hypothetical protein